MSLISKYTAQLKALLPRGAAWVRDMGTHIHLTLEAFAVEFATVETRSLQLLSEIDPRTTTELLPEWERAFGLPETCAASPDTLSGRQRALHEKVTRQGGQSRQYYIDVAARLGFVVTISEPRPWTVLDQVNEGIWSEDITFTWIVNAPEETITDFTVLSGVNEPLRDWGNELLECVISRLKPAHTTVLFSYS